MKMNQAGMDKGTRDESGEREPKGVKASDAGGEKKERIVAGVALGKADKMTGRDASHVGKHEGDVGEANEGRKNGIVYAHKRTAYGK